MANVNKQERKNIRWQEVMTKNTVAIASLVIRQKDKFVIVPSESAGGRAFDLPGVLRIVEFKTGEYKICYYDSKGKPTEEKNFLFEPDALKKLCEFLVEHKEKTKKAGQEAGQAEQKAAEMYESVKPGGTNNISGQAAAGEQVREK